MYVLKLRGHEVHLNEDGKSIDVKCAPHFPSLSMMNKETFIDARNGDNSFNNKLFS